MPNRRAGRFDWPWECFAAALVFVFGLTLAAAENTDALYGENGVSPQAVRQGVLGSCYFHASIASLAQSTPETLRNSISATPGGGYQVRFFDGPAEQVFAEDVEYGRAHGYDSSEGKWVLVLMRAYAQRTVRLSLVNSIQQSPLIPAIVKPIALSWLDQSSLLLVAYDRTIRSVIQQDGVLDKAALKIKLADQLKALGVPEMQAGMLGGFLDEQGLFDALALTVRQNGEVFGDYKGLGQGGIPERVMQAFLGHAGTAMVAGDRQLPERLLQLHSGTLAMVSSTWDKVPGEDFPEGRADWWVPNHAYSVLDFDPASQTVRLRNPWGRRPGPDGTFKLPLAIFLRAYQIYFHAESGAP
jgi:hypothetical protein